MENERTLDETQEEEEIQAAGQADTSEEAEEDETEEESSEEESEAETLTLESVLPRLSEAERKEIETLRKKARDFDGLAAKKRRLEPQKETKADDSVEKAVRSVLQKDVERHALREVIDPKSDLYIPELVSDSNFAAIRDYLPRNVDKSSAKSIHRALKIATKLWKEDTGKAEEKKDAEFAATRGGRGSSGETGEKPKGRTFLKSQPGIESWYKKE